MSLRNYGDFRLPTALSYLEYLLQRHDEYEALYWEDTAHEKDPVVEDIRTFLVGVPRPAEKCTMGPRARLVAKKAWEMRPVKCVDTNETFRSVREASKHFNIDRFQITRSARFNMPARQLTFKYADEVKP